MAESIIIHFDVSSPSQVIECLNRAFDHQNENSWYHPKEDYLIMIDSFEDYEVEYERKEKEIIEQKLMATPKVSYEFEIRRSKSDEACDLIEKFIKTELNGLKFIVDDMDQIYTKDEINEVSDFLDIYRYKKLKSKSAQ